MLLLELIYDAYISIILVSSSTVIIQGAMAILVMDMGLRIMISFLWPY